MTINTTSKPNTNYLKMLKRIKEFERDTIKERIKIVNEILFMETEPNNELKNYEMELVTLIQMKNLALADIQAIQNQIDIKLDTEKEEEEEIEKKYVI